MLTSTTYLTYIIISIFITVFVSRSLSKNGIAFLVAGFKGNRELAESTNHLLVVGFYLVNLGFVLLRMRTGVYVETIEEMITYLASGIGLVLLVLGLMHFFNMFVIHRISSSNLDLVADPEARA